MSERVKEKGPPDRVGSTSLSFHWSPFHLLLPDLVPLLVCTLICHSLPLAMASVCRGPDPERIMAVERASGFLTSPNYPQPYQVGQRCLYELSAPISAALVIKVELVELDLAEPYNRSRQCLWDYMLFAVFDREGREHISQRYCGRPQQLPSLNTMQSKVQILFVSAAEAHARHSHRGFKMKYQFVPEVEIGAPPSLFYDTNHKLQRECGGSTSVNEISGEVASPGFPHTYPRNVTCYWLIRVPVKRRIYLRLTHLHLSTTLAECDRASLAFIDGYRHDLTMSTRRTRGSQQGDDVQFCGNQLYYNEEGMKSYLSTGNRVVIRCANGERDVCPRSRFTTNDYPSLEQQQNYLEEGTPIGFKVVWTEVHQLVSSDEEGEEESDCKGFTCRGGEFCIDDGQNICAERTRLCINETLRCNAVSNCAENDHSDEDLCYSERVFVYGMGMVVLLISACLCCLGLRYTSRSRRMEPVDRVISAQPSNQIRLHKVERSSSGSTAANSRPAHPRPKRRASPAECRPSSRDEMVVWQIAPRPDLHSDGVSIPGVDRALV